MPLPIQPEPPRLTRANALLADQHARLSAVTVGTAPPEVKSMARHYLAKVRTWQGHPEASRDLCLGAMGPNGYGPAIDDVCKQARFHSSAAVEGAVKQARAA